MKKSFSRENSEELKSETNEERVPLCQHSDVAEFDGSVKSSSIVPPVSSDIFRKYNTFKALPNLFKGTRPHNRIEEEITGATFGTHGYSQLNEDDHDKPLIWKQVVASLGTGLTHFAVVAMVGFPAIALPELMDPKSGDMTLDKDQATLFSSILYIGGIFGSLLSGPLNVFLGQRILMILCMPIAMVGWIAISQTKSQVVLLAMRVMHGIITGILTISSSNYLVEVSHSSIRGRLMGFAEVLRQGGLLFVYLIGSLGLGWRNVALICGLSSLGVPFLIFAFMPNSPRWLITKEKYEEAFSSLLFFRGRHYEAVQELEDIKDDVIKKGRSKSVMDQFKLLRERSIYKIMILLSFCMAITPFVGNFVVLNYAVTIFRSAKSSIDEYLGTILIGVARIVGAVLYLLMLDKLGRRPILIIPFFFCGICLIVFGIYLYISTFHDVSSIAWLPVVTLVSFNLLLTMCVPIVHLLKSELLPTSVRAISTAIHSTISNVSTFLVTLSYPYLASGIGAYPTFFLYAMNCFIMSLIGHFAIPETKGKSLEEIERLYSRG